MRARVCLLFPCVTAALACTPPVASPDAGPTPSDGGATQADGGSGAALAELCRGDWECASGWCRHSADRPASCSQGCASQQECPDPLVCRRAFDDANATTWGCSAANGAPIGAACTASPQCASF